MNTDGHNEHEPHICVQCLQNDNDELREALVGMIDQFAPISNGHIHTHGLTVLWEAFEALGWDDPHPYPVHKDQKMGNR